MSNPMMQAMQQLQQMQEKMEQAQGELGNLSVTEEGGGGLVRVTMNGRREITKLELKPEAMKDGDREMLEDLLMSTINRAITSASVMAERHLAEATRGMMPNIPGLNLPL